MLCKHDCVKPGVNFINVLWAAFKSAYPKSAVTLSVFFALLESASVKAALGMLMKLTNPGSNAIKKIYS